MAFLCNWMLVSSSVLKDDNSLRIFKESPNEFEYMVKRHDANDRKEDTESKERRSTMGSSFIRFGRGQSAFNTIDNSAFDNEIDPKVSRHPRWKSPDVVIRFGRSDFKTTNSEQPKRGKNDLNFIRYLFRIFNLVVICHYMSYVSYQVMRRKWYQIILKYCWRARCTPFYKKLRVLRARAIFTACTNNENAGVVRVWSIKYRDYYHYLSSK